MLQRGFTTVRDAAGADFGLQLAVERGLFAGPRLHIAGRPLTQTGGHADVRPQGRAGNWSAAAPGWGCSGAIADGVAEVRRAVREQVRNGANQIKIMAGGGVASPTDPIDGTQYSLDELRAPSAKRPRPPTPTRWPMPIHRAPSRARCARACGPSSTATCWTRPAPG
jgi:imidazolonepropionase-like amidohydrolase